MDDLQLQIVCLLVKERCLARHIRFGIIIGDDELTKGRAFFLRHRVIAAKGQNVKVLIKLSDEGAVVVREYDIALTAGHHLPEPNMEALRITDTAGCPIHSLRVY